ncbi:MAG: hypothetical protein EXR57_05185 [Dehalococcoidia bacterium]|nr:hypothetical protein [Dehalococcoidia bacterium]
MPIQIVDADIQHLKRASRTGRVRAKDIQQIIKAIQELGPGKAKALVPERGETVVKLRTKLSYAARAAGVKLRVVKEENRILFALKGGRRGVAVKSGAADRKRLVQQKALQLGKGARKSLTAEDVLKAFDADGVSLGMARPATMVGAILRSMPEFKRTGKNTFTYHGKATAE